MSKKQIVVLFIGFLFVFNALNCRSNRKENANRAGARHPDLRMLPVAEGLGVNIHFYKGNANDLNMMTKAGVGIVRMDVSWGGAEKEPDKYNFSNYDQLVSDLESRGIRLLFILDYGNALYDGGLAPHSEKSRAAFARFAAALAKRYAGKNIIWELWNEPNLDKFWRPKSNVSDYMAWCKAVVPAIRRADTSACIVGPAVSSIDFSFLDSCFKKGLLNLVDGVTVHPYRSPGRSPETAIAEYNQLKLLIEQYRPKEKDIPILSGEWGYNTTVMSRELQGKYLPRQWLSNLSAGVPISIWYDWHDDGRDPHEGEHNFGTVTWDYKPKPSYIAMSALIRQLRGFEPLDRIGVGNVHDYVLPFVKGNQVKLAVWSTTKTHTLDWMTELKISRAIDYLGQPVEKSKPVSDDAPVYLTLASPLPPWLQMIVTAGRLKNDESRKIAHALTNKKFSNPLSKQIFDAIRNGTAGEKSAAYHVMVQLAEKSDQQTALKLYHRVLKSSADMIEKKRALYNVAKIGSAKSMDVVVSLENDPGLAEAAASYYLHMALILAESDHNKEAKQLLLRALQYSHQRSASERILAELRERGAVHENNAQIAARDGFVNAWWVAGPFPNKNDRAEKTSFFPEKKIDFSQRKTFAGLVAKWQKYETDNIWGIIPLAEMFGRKQEAAYAYAEIIIPHAFPALFKIGSNDGVVCWLNGAKVHENFASRPLTIDEDIVPVHLKKGRNRILLKIPNKGANWEVCLRVCGQNGKPLDLQDKIKMN
ncbi:MAG: glycoside hydrolase family 5 protein [Calditrichaeota bacterium]|nr:glycoside hydrolase family 5 protein [Calditrichota bacterium]